MHTEKQPLFLGEACPVCTESPFCHPPTEQEFSREECLSEVFLPRVCARCSEALRRHCSPSLGVREKAASSRALLMRLLLPFFPVLPSRDLLGSAHPLGSGDAAQE